MSRRRKKLEAEQAALAEGDDLARAFPAYPCPGSSAVIHFPGDNEREAAARLLAGVSWPALTWDYVCKHYPCDRSALPSWLNPNGYAYYLPAFIRMCRDHPEEVDCLPDNLLWHFSNSRHDIYAIIALLDDTQRRCVAEFFRSFYLGPHTAGGKSHAYSHLRPDVEDAWRALGFDLAEEEAKSQV